MSTFLRFDCFEVDLAAGRLLKHGVRIHLREQSFQVLELLLARPGEVVTREELRQRLWPTDVFVDFENNLNTAVARLREALGDSAEHPRFIETLPKRGYRLLVAMSASAAAPAAVQAARPQLPALTTANASGHRPAGKPTEDAVAYNEYARGIFYVDHLGAGSRGHETARAHLETALARDPGFALAHEALAHVYWLLGYIGFMPPRDAFAAGILHAVRALEIDNTRAETHALIAQFRKQLDYDWPAIERDMTRALELNPASPLVKMLHAVGWLMPQGRLGEAIAELERALEQDPLSYQLHFWRAIMLSLAREPDRVIEQGRLMIELDPTVPHGPWVLGVGLSRKGQFDEAIAFLRRAVELSNGLAMMLGWLGLILGAGGRTEEARGVLDRLEAMNRASYVAPASIAWVYLGLREVNRAFEWLDRAVDGRDQLMMPIKTYAFFDPIRTDPRFHALLRKMKLAAE
jgi:DNA-binding winged helix-turn-helix (wHTH) protein